MVCICTLPATQSFKLDVYRQAQKADQVCGKVIQYCRSGWPATVGGACLGTVLENQKCVHSPQSPPCLTIVLLYPSHCRRTHWRRFIHTGHQGIVRCQSRAKPFVWWPGISKQVAEVAKVSDLCKRCRTMTGTFDADSFSEVSMANDGFKFV